MPIFIPKYYKIDKLSSKEAYTRHETGNASVERLLQRQDDYWIKDGNASKKDAPKKVLILHDWISHAWPEYKCLALKDRLLECIDLGYEVRLGDAYFTPVTKKEIDVLLAYYKNVVLLERDAALCARAATYLKRAARDFLSLNYFELNRLLDNAPEPKRQILASDLSGLEGSSFLKRIAFLNQLKIDAIVCDQFGVLFQDYYFAIFKNNAHVKQFCALPQIKAEVSEYTFGSANSSDPTAHEASFIKENQLTEVNNLSLYCTSLLGEKPVLSSKNCPNLKELQLYTIFICNEPDDPEPNPWIVEDKQAFAHLECLDLSFMASPESDAEFEVVRDFLRRMPRLRVLKLKHCSLELFKKLTLDSLERLEIEFLNHVSVSTDEIYTAIQATQKKLKSFQITVDEITGNFSKSEQEKIQSLQLDRVRLFHPSLKLSDKVKGGLALVQSDRYQTVRDSLNPNLVLYLMGHIASFRRKGLKIINDASLIQSKGKKRAKAAELNLQVFDETSLLGFNVDFSLLEELRLNNIKSENLNIARIFLENSKGLSKLHIDIGEQKYAVTDDSFLDDIDMSQMETVALKGVVLTEERLLDLLLRAPFLAHFECHEGLLPKTYSTALRAALAPFGYLQPKRATVSTGKKMDADTALKNNKFSCDRVFYAKDANHPVVNYYRKEVYNMLEVNPNVCSPEMAFELKKTEPMGDSIKPKPKKSEQKDLWDNLPHHDGKYSYFFGKEKLVINSEWQSLTSLSGNEEMLEYQLSEDVLVDIQDFNRDGLYYIKCQDALSGVVEIEIEFTLKVPKKKVTLPADVQAILDKYKAFNRFIKWGLNFGSGE
ncbi:MAG: hypothetical protein QNK11_01585 [Legionella sp.]|nr:hypothetical protein [Legionella sp.]